MSVGARIAFVLRSLCPFLFVFACLREVQGCLRYCAIFFRLRYCAFVCSGLREVHVPRLTRGAGLRNLPWEPENAVEHIQRQHSFTPPHPFFIASPVNFAEVLVVMSTKRKRGGIMSGIRLPCIAPAFEEQIV